MDQDPEIKRDYGKPKLVVYGDIRLLTSATGSKKKRADGGMGQNNKT
jgi:hypothetical protein